MMGTVNKAVYWNTTAGCWEKRFLRSPQQALRVGTSERSEGGRQVFLLLLLGGVGVGVLRTSRGSSCTRFISGFFGDACTSRHSKAPGPPTPLVGFRVPVRRARRCLSCPLARRWEHPLLSLGEARWSGYSFLQTFVLRVRLPSVSYTAARSP